MARQRRPKTATGNAGRVVAYRRVSALMGRGGDDFHSPDLQLEAIRRLTTTAGLQEVEVVDDIDVSGQTFSRKGIDRIRELVEAKAVDVVAVYDLSRLGRNLAESLAFLKWLDEHGVTIMSTREHIDDTPQGRFMLAQFLSLAQLSGDQIGQRWAEVIAYRARQGKRHGNVPQGYLKVDGHLQPDPTLAPAVKAMFEQYAAGIPVVDITAAFAAARGREIARSVVKVMLRNPVYVGRVVIHSKTAGIIDLPGEHPPLVDQQLWDKVQHRMAADRTTPARILTPSYSLTGLLRCADCGYTLQVTYSTEHGKGENERTMRVFCKRKNEMLACDGVGAPVYDRVEAYLLNEVRNYAAQLRGNPGARAAQLGRTKRAGTDAATVERELVKTREAMARLTERWARGNMPESAYETAMARLAETERAQAAQLDRARDVSTAPKPGKVVALVDRMLELWPDMTGTERNRALRTVLVSATVRRTNFWREPVENRIFDVEFRW